MRRLEAGATPTSPIWDLWTNGTNQLGENRANAIVTVEPDWFLNKTSRQWGNSKRGPFRWYQRQDNSQTEVQIPNVKNIQMDRSIDTDAGNCVITIINSYLDFSEALTLAGQLGDPGHFSWARGASDEGEARWGHVANEWADVLIPNALIRTYQGYGGHDLTLEEAVDAGNLVLTGVWLVDAVSIDAQQQLVLNCRDMAKMLIEQVLYKPLVPNRLYPLRYCNTGEAPIWMSDYTFKSIEDVVVGDEIIGWEERISEGCQQPRKQLIVSRVEATGKRWAEVVKVTMESGAVLRCTPDHLWLKFGATGKANAPYEFVEPKVGRSLVRAVGVPTPLTDPEEVWAAGYLAGVWDGEGTGIRISQFESVNSEVCDKIAWCLDRLQIPYTRNPDAFFLTGPGRAITQTLVNFLNWCKPAKRGNEVAKSILKARWQHEDKIVAIEPDGEDWVYSLTTSTGNYVAWGLASKNCRWYRKDFDSSFSARPTAAALTAASTTSAPSGSVKMTYRHSSADAWYDYDANIHGHRGTDSVDGRQETYALSVGNSHPSKSFCTDFFEYEPAGPVEWIYIHPWGGNYETYISIKEGGRWLGEERVPYDHTPLVGTQPVAVDTLADKFYVLKTSVPWETGTWIRLPRRFNAQRVRVTFRNHTKSEWGPWFYRCGIREIQGGIGAREDRSSSGTTKGVSHIPWTFGGAIFRDDDSELEEGYYVIDESGRLFAFGDARTLPQTGGGGHDDFTVAMRSWHNGAWSLQQNGRVQAYGSVEHYGDAADEGRDDFIDMAPTNTGEGYYLLARDGVVFGYGDALLYGDAASTGDTFDERAYTGTGIETHPVENGYWIVDGDGIVQDFGDVPSHGSVSPYRTGMEEHAWVRAIRRNQDGDGYWLLSGDGNVYAKGACEHFGELDDALKRDDLGAEGFRKLCWDFFPTNTDQGYYILQADGTILYYGDAEYFGQPGGYGIMRSPGNYEDYSDIVRDILLWSGWLFYGDDEPNERPPVYGNIETTGAYADECIAEDLFDKKHPIDVINELKEIVGYIAWCDDEGAYRFESPNFWKIGNFYDDGESTDFIPEIDEQLSLTAYSVSFDDTNARSQVIIASQLPEKADKTTVTTRYTPATVGILRGMTKPAIWVNGVFTNPAEQRIMAELIGMHIWFSTRIGRVTCYANPGIQINDQVRIFERQTAETYIHYIRAISTNHDLLTGEYTMTLETNWLGDQDSWIITADNIPDAGESGLVQWRISEQLMEWLEHVESNAVTIARLSGFDVVDGPTSFSDAVVAGDAGEDGAANAE